MSYLRDYLEYASGNEAPEMFHVWGAYVSLSAAVSRRVWLPFEDTAIFPNVYVMYVGPAGNGKTWAMRKVKRVLAELPDVPISGSVETPPGLWRFMTGNPNSDPPKPSPVAYPVRWPDGGIRDIHPMTIVANEFVNFISIDEKGWVSSLNDIYDEDIYKYRTKNMGEDIIEGPCIILLGALTNEVASDLQKSRIIATGLARRTLFQYGERQWFNPHPKPKFLESQQQARARCVAHLKKLSKGGGAFVWTDAIDEWWAAWYGPDLAKVPRRPPATQSWFASKSIQVLKLAMLTCLSEPEAGLTLEIKHFETALEFLGVLEKDLFRIFGGVGRNELAAVAIKIGEFIETRNTPVTKRDLKLNFFTQCKPPNEFEDCLRWLLDGGQIIEGTIHLGNLVDTIYATRETMSKFEVEVRAKGGTFVGATQPGITLDIAPVENPSLVPTANPWDLVLELNQVVAESVDETEDGSPLRVETEED